MKTRTKVIRDGVQPEYEFDYSKAVRGKHHRRMAHEGVNVVVLDPDVAEVFHDSVAVNEALRTLLRVEGKRRRSVARPRTKARRRAS
jgi:hypothetical protein